MKVTPLILAAALLSAPVFAKPVTILVQMKTYEGDKSYSSLYLVNPSGRYDQTLWVSGDEEKWYEEGLSRWWKYLSRKPQDIDALTGATTASGDRYIVKVDLPSSMLDSGYKLRVESSVEDQENHTVDVEVPLIAANIKDKIPGTGYVRYLRFKW